MPLPRVSSTASELNDFNEEEGKKIYHVSKSRLVSLISWVHVFGVYLPLMWCVIVGMLAMQVLKVLYEHRFDLKAFYLNEINEISFDRPLVLDLGWKTMALLALLLWFLKNREKPVYLIDFATFEPPKSWKVSQEELMKIMEFQNCFSKESLEFCERMLAQSGVGPATAWPPGIVR